MSFPLIILASVKVFELGVNYRQGQVFCTLIERQSSYHCVLKKNMKVKDYDLVSFSQEYPNDPDSPHIPLIVGLIKYMGKACGLH
jgi:hypothetical protein